MNKGLWIWTRTQMTTSVIHIPMKTQDLTNSITHKSDDYFGMQYSRCCVSCSCTGQSCQWIALHVISAVALHIAVREKCPDLFENSSILDYNATTHSVDTLRMLASTEIEKFYGTFFVHLTLVQETTICFPNWSIRCVGNNLQKERTFWQQFSVMCTG